MVKGSNFRIQHVDADWVLSIRLDPASVEAAKLLYDDLHDQVVAMDIRKDRSKRSLTANAYFHALVNKIAHRIGADAQTVKRELVLSYGVIDADDEGELVTVACPRGHEPQVPYPKWLQDVNVNGAVWDIFLCFKETHRMDSAEMAALIDGTITEAKELGIETLPPAELERMVNSWQSTK